MDRGGKEVFREARLPNCYLHLAWARRSYLDTRSPVSVWWDYALVREDLQGNRGNLFGMYASSAALVKAFIELDPYQARGIGLTNHQDDAFVAVGVRSHGLNPTTPCHTRNWACTSR